MTKRVFLVHGWGGSPDSGWFPWLKSELEEKGFEVHALAMPNTEFPIIDEWVGFLKKTIGAVDKDVYFLGHSIGCQTIMRFLQDAAGQYAGGVLFVAGWINLQGLETQEENEIAKPWLETPIDYGEVRLAAGKVTAIFSANDPYVPLTDSVLFKEKLGAKILVENNAEHFNNPTEARKNIILNELLNLAE
jgi:predicted alpha/beta hydrolase family esterase